MNYLPKINRNSQHDIVEVWSADLLNFSGRFECSLSGFEFLVPPYPAQNIRFEEQNLTPSPNSIILFTGAAPHTETYDHGQGLLKSIVVKPEFIADFCAPLEIDPKDIRFTSPELKVDVDIATLVSQLIEATLTKNSSKLLIESLTTDLLFRTLIYQDHSKQNVLLKESEYGHFPSLTRKVQSTCIDHLRNPNFNLDILSSEVGISKFHLIREFKKKTGRSPANYLSELKIEMAKIALVRTKKSILTIAMDLGYSDLSTFNKSFKKNTGVTPSQFRAAA